MPAPTPTGLNPTLIVFASFLDTAMALWLAFGRVAVTAGFQPMNEQHWSSQIQGIVAFVSGVLATVGLRPNTSGGPAGAVGLDADLGRDERRNRCHFWRELGLAVGGEEPTQDQNEEGRKSDDQHVILPIW